MASPFAIMERRESFAQVEALQRISLLKILDYIPNYLKDIAVLPANLKHKILFLMLKRGLVSDSNIAQLLSEKIRVLDLKECDVSDQSLIEIASKCQFLQTLDLNALKDNRTSVTSNGLMVLAQHCPNLQSVHLRRCVNVTDDAVVQLSKCCRMLRELNIGGCPLISDVSLFAIGENSSHLNSINFSKADVSDEGVISLVRGGSAGCLKEIHMDGCVRVTDESIEAIVQFCPNISILLYHGCPNTSERSRVVLEEVLASRPKMTHLTWTIY